MNEEMSRPKTMKMENDELMKLCRKYFSSMDKNKDGKLNRHEFSDMCREIGCTHDVTELKKAYNKTDKNGDGIVSFAEFMESYARNCNITKEIPRLSISISNLQIFSSASPFFKRASICD